jgi:streptogramin lyase
MPVGSTGKRCAFVTVAIIAGALLWGFGATAATPYVTETAVPGASASQLADGLDATWVAGAEQAGDNQIVKVDPSGAKTFYKMPANSPRAEDLTVTSVPLVGDSVWASGTFVDRSDLQAPHTGMLFQLNPGAAIPVPVMLVSHPGFDIRDVASDPAGNVWYAEASSSAPVQLRIGGFDSAGTTVEPFSFPNAEGDDLVPRPQDEGVFFIERSAAGTSVAKFDTNTHTITREYDLGSDETADSLVSGPDDALWFRERLATGATSITRMATTGPDEGLPQHHDVSAFLSIDRPTDGALAVADGGLWFVTGDALGRMTTAGEVSNVLCVAPSRPNALVASPDDQTLTFTESTDTIGRLATDANGLPCPVPVVPGRSGSPKPLVVDTTPAKISVGGKAAQRFTKKGTIAITVACNEACGVVAQATVSTPGASRLFRSLAVSRILSADKATKLTLEFKKSAVKSIRRFWTTKKHRKKHLKARIAITTKDGAGNKGSANRTIKLKR